MSQSNIELFKDMPNGKEAIARLPHSFLDSLHLDQLESLSRSWGRISKSPEFEAYRDDSAARIISSATGEEIWYYMNPYEGEAIAISVDDRPHPMELAAHQLSGGAALAPYDDEAHDRRVEQYRRHGRQGDNFNVYEQEHWSGFGQTHDRHLSKYAVEHAADSQYRRRFGRLDRDTPAYREIYEQITKERETPTISFDELGPLELAPSGSAPELPFPAARISTVSGTIVFNQSFINRLRGEFTTLPTWVEVSQAKGGQMLVFRFLDEYERGAYKLGTPTMYNRGWSISPKSLIGRLVSHKANELPRVDGSDRHGKAADLIFGRRRLFQVSGTPFWAMDLRSEIV